MGTANDTAHRRGVWTGEAETTLRLLWSKGESASTIARQIPGFTRNAIIGKASRLELQRRGADNRAANKARKKSRRVPSFPAQSESVTLPPPRVTARISLTTSAKESPPSVDATLALRSQQCRWPIGAGYCDQIKSYQSYCPEHEEASRERKR